jgi:hypothetical protein
MPKLSSLGFSCSKILLATLLTITFPMPSHATPEPEYQVVQSLADFEVRQYAAYTVAEVVVTGPSVPHFGGLHLWQKQRRAKI